MNAAIKCLEDTLLIRRLQARDLGRAGDNAGDRAMNLGRMAALHEDIASLERGLSTLSGERGAESVGKMPDACSVPKTINHQPSTIS